VKAQFVKAQFVKAQFVKALHHYNNRSTNT